MKMALIHRYRR